MKTLFDPVRIGGLALKNRIIRSATHERAYDEQGRFAPILGPIYKKLAEGGVGAIVTGMMGAGPSSRLMPRTVDANGKTAVAGLRELAGTVHPYGCKLLVQLSHCGQRSTVTENDGPAIGPVDTVQPSGKPVRAMTTADIARVAAGFADASARCREAGVDGVEIHGAHGYGLSQFLSPYFNKRRDEYGGDMAGRSRIIFEVYDAIRAKVGTDYPVWIKISGRELVDDSSTWDEILWLCAELEKRGINAIELSGGIGEDDKSKSAQFVKDEEDEGTFAPEALALAAALAVPVVSVCGYRTPAVINGWLNKGNIEGISLCRPLIAEPDLVNRWANGDTAKARCISCNKCYKPKAGFGCQVF
ncbi:putative NADH:flavin oxidoreductase [uncultured delta proteobacterium]|uniref:Putative NADH:flavin oxidoreductase n=1 Tax=uncultured delta proteobacterium TaxID=34034 RepID=A0A212JZR3_9DELT|nr:putative NADH:flavin oxidoreductase [uncultured delta proteobacterium]